MCQEGLGLMLYNGANGLMYYSSQAARVFVSNAGFVATLAVGGYFFPVETVSGVVGAAAIRGATWLTQRVDRDYDVHIAQGVEKVLDLLPTRISGGYMRMARQIGSPQRFVSTRLATTPQLRWVNESLATELISPLLEESIFRLGLQEGIALGLQALRVPRGMANSLALMIAAPTFAGAHDGNPGGAHYRATLISGLGFGIMMYIFGLPGAVVAHSANNAGVRLELALGR